MEKWKVVVSLRWSNFLSAQKIGKISVWCCNLVVIVTLVLGLNRWPSFTTWWLLSNFLPNSWSRWNRRGVSKPTCQIFSSVYQCHVNSCIAYAHSCSGGNVFNMAMAVRVFQFWMWCLVQVSYCEWKCWNDNFVCVLVFLSIWALPPIISYLISIVKIRKSWAQRTRSCTNSLIASRTVDISTASPGSNRKQERRKKHLRKMNITHSVSCRWRASEWMELLPIALTLNRMQSLVMLGFEINV